MSHRHRALFIHLIRNCRTVGLALLTIVSLASSQIPAAEPAIIVSIKSFGELEKDVGYIANTLQQPLLGVMFPGMVAQLTGGKGLAGMDVQKPLGGFLTLAPDGQPGDVVVIVPVSDQKMFAATLAAIFPNPQPVDGLMRYQQSGAERQFFGKEGSTHFLFATSAAALADKIDPQRILNSAVDIGIDLDLTKLPDALKEQFLAQVEAGAAAAADSKQPDSESRRRGEELGRQVTLNALRKILMEGVWLQLGLNVDAKGKTVSLDAGFKSKAGTSLAAACRNYSTVESPFSGLVHEKTIASLLVSVPLHTEAQKMIDFAFEQGERSAAAAVEKVNPAEREVAERLTQQISKTIRQAARVERLDQALIVNATENGRIQVLVTSRLNQGSGLANAFEEVVRKDPDAGKRISLNVATVGPARVHAITFPAEADLQKRFGDGPAHVALAGDAAWFVLGGDSLADLKTALAAKPAKSNRPPVSLRVALAKVWAVLQAENAALVPLGAAAFQGADDQIALEVAPQTDGIRLHLEIQEGVLRLIGLSASQARGQ